MCLAIPAKVIEIVEDGRARVSLGGVRQEIDTALIEELAVGDYVIVHVGFALGKLSPEEAERTLELMAEAGIVSEAEAAP